MAISQGILTEIWRQKNQEKFQHQNNSYWQQCLHIFRISLVFSAPEQTKISNKWISRPTTLQYSTKPSLNNLNVGCVHFTMTSLIKVKNGKSVSSFINTKEDTRYTNYILPKMATYFPFTETVKQLIEEFGEKIFI